MTYSTYLPVTRFGFASIIAFTISFLLFCLMHYLVQNPDEGKLIKGKPFKFPPFVYVPPIDNPPPVREPTPDEVMEPPVEPVFESPETFGPDDYLVEIPETKLPGPTTLNHGQIDNEAIAIVKPQAHYPEPAIRKGLQGYAIVEYTVSTLGTTKNIRIIASEPGSVFDRAAVRATEKFKYKPKIVNGKAVEMHGLQNKFTFELED